MVKLIVSNHKIIKKIYFFKQWSFLDLLKVKVIFKIDPLIKSLLKIFAKQWSVFYLLIKVIVIFQTDPLIKSLLKSNSAKRY